MIKSLSIVIPIFNEEKRILESLFKIKNFLNKIKKKIKIQIVFVDDGSTDNSILLLEQFLKKNKINNKIIKLEKNSGKGGALKVGVLKCDYTWILTCDLDMSVALYEIIKWLKKKIYKQQLQYIFWIKKA